MGIKSIAIVGAACAAGLAAPCPAQELRAPGTTFFMELPLDARSAAEQHANFGLQLQGSRPSQSLRLDQRTLRLLPEAIAGIDTTWLVAGAVGVVAVASIAAKDKGASQQMDQQKQQQAQDCPPCAP